MPPRNESPVKGPKITDEWRAAFGAALRGKTIAALEWSAEADGSDGYWVMTFTDGSETCFSRTMAELAIEGAGR